MKRLGTWLAVSGLVFLLSGCETVRLYNKAADVAATSAKTDYDASKVAESLKGERAMLDGLEAKEVDAYRKVTQAQRNLELLSLLSESGKTNPPTTSDGLVSRFHALADTRLLELSSQNATPLAMLKELDQNKRALRDAGILEQKARSQLVTFNAKFAALPACNTDVANLKNKSSPADAAALTKDKSFDPATIPGSPAWTIPISTLGTRCGELLDARGAMDAWFKKTKTGQVGRAIQSAQDQEDALTQRQTDAKTAAANLKTAAANLAAAQKAAKDASQSVDLTCDFSKPNPAATDQVAQKKNDLCDALKKLNDLGDFGIKVLSEEKLARINTVLAAMSGIEPAAGEPPLEPSLALLGASSRFGQALRKYQAAKTLPALEPLLIERQIAAAQLAYAQAGVELAQTRVRYAQDYREATILEVDLLVKAKAELGALGTRPADGTPCSAANAVFCASMNQMLNDKSLSGISTGNGESANRRTYRAVAFLSESYSVARDRQRTAEVKLIDTDYRDSLLRSEASVAAWNALVSVPVDQLAALYKDGWTPLEIAQFLQSFGVVGVAARIK